jgi:DNA-binding transcriptional ArsR family regulator
MSLLKILFPRARAEILRLLFVPNQTELHLRELVRQSGLTLGTVQQELEKLYRADLLISRRDGNRRYYRANREHPVFSDLQQLVLKTAGLRDVLHRALAAIRGIDVAFIFGSLAAKAGQADSDVDLMVIGKAGLRELAPALRKASQTVGREINPHTYTPFDWRKQRRARDPFLRNVMATEKLFLEGDAHELARLG